MKKVRVLIVFLTLLSICGLCQTAEDMKLREANIGKGFVPNNGFVPDSVTAIKIAVAVLIPIYGEKIIGSQHPFTSVLSKDVWVVSGSVPKGHVGGVAEIRISKATGAILRVVHTK